MQPGAAVINMPCQILIFRLVCLPIMGGIKLTYFHNIPPVPGCCKKQKMKFNETVLDLSKL